MQLTPRYGINPIIRLDGEPSAIFAPATRQRRRLATALASFGDEQWTHPSRCAGWSNRDVIVHLDTTNNFWTFSIEAGQRREPTTFLATFDPVASPAQMVTAAQELSAHEVLDRFEKSTAKLEETLCAVAGDDWLALAEAPPGHISISALVHHALWDSWVHERDVLLPLGITPDEQPDEIAACLRYVAALAPAISLTIGTSNKGRLGVEATNPDTAFVVEISDHVHVGTGSAPADLRLTGDAVELVEALSIRQPLAQSIPADFSWMVSGLAEIFDAA
ncbi:hypothetical protein BH10ACT2_BH10ACT2_18460 [soil metagenome]